MATAEGGSEKAVPVVPVVPALPIPAFADIGKAANDLINKDFYHTSQANLEVKLKAPNGTNVTVKGKQSFDHFTTGSIEGKHTLKPHGRQANSYISTSDKRFIDLMQMIQPLPSFSPAKVCIIFTGVPNGQGSQEKIALSIRLPSTGVSLTQSWTTASLLDSKIELADNIAPGVKVDIQNLWNPSKAASAAQKLTFAFKNPTVHSRAFVNYANASGNIDAVVDVTAGHDGFLVGGEAGYDVQKAAVTKYSLALAYQTPTYTASITGVQNLSVIAASYYQKVNSAVEVGAKAGYDVQNATASGLELASKYRLDPLSFAKAKINDRGIAALAYSTKLNAGTTIGLGLSLDTNKLNQAGHKIGTSLTFEG